MIFKHRVPNSFHSDDFFFEVLLKPLKLKLIFPYSMEQCRSTCYFDDSLGMIGMRTGFGTRISVPRIVEDDAVVIQEDQSEEMNICKLPPVAPHLRACLAFMPKWTYDFR